MSMNDNSRHLYTVRYDFESIRKMLDNKTFSQVSSDTKDPGLTIEEELKERDAEYTKLLRLYVKVTSIRYEAKEKNKRTFFRCVIIGSSLFLLLVYAVVFRIVFCKEMDIVIEAMPVLITALVAFVSTIIAIPLTITQYLFNTKEDDNITEIIKHTQEHDSAGRSLFKDRFSRPKREEFSSSKSDDD